VAQKKLPKIRKLLFSMIKDVENNLFLVAAIENNLFLTTVLRWLNTTKNKKNTENELFSTAFSLFLVTSDCRKMMKFL
jgi:hypothetical protein